MKRNINRICISKMLLLKSEIYRLLVCLLFCLCNKLDGFRASEDMSSRNTEERERYPESSTKSNCVVINIMYDNYYDGADDDDDDEYCKVRIWDQDGTFIK